VLLIVVVETCDLLDDDPSSTLILAPIGYQVLVDNDARHIRNPPLPWKYLDKGEIYHPILE
jgi:hypothetical protein